MASPRMRMASAFILGLGIYGQSPPVSQAQELRCQGEIMRAMLNRSGESPDEAVGELQYCRANGGEFSARVTLRKLHPQAQYLLNLTGSPGAPGNDQLTKRCERTPDGRGYCDFRTVITNARGEIDAVVSVGLDAGDYQAKFFVKNLSKEPRYRVVLFNDSPRFTVLPARGPAVELLSPQTDAQVEHTALIKGRVSDRGHSIYVLVHPIADTKWWVQRSPSPPNRDGTWQAIGYFGVASGKGVGEYFEVVAIAVPDKGLLQEGQQLDHPRVLQLLERYPRSDIVTVRRVR